MTPAHGGTEEPLLLLAPGADALRRDVARLDVLFQLFNPLQHPGVDEIPGGDGGCGHQHMGRGRVSGVPWRRSPWEERGDASGCAPPWPYLRPERAPTISSTMEDGLNFMSIISSVHSGAFHAQVRTIVKKVPAAIAGPYGSPPVPPSSRATGVLRGAPPAGAGRCITRNTSRVSRRPKQRQLQHHDAPGQGGRNQKREGPLAQPKAQHGRQLHVAGPYRPHGEEQKSSRKHRGEAAETEHHARQGEHAQAVAKPGPGRRNEPGPQQDGRQAVRLCGGRAGPQQTPPKQRPGPRWPRPGMPYIVMAFIACPCPCVARAGGRATPVDASG